MDDDDDLAECARVLIRRHSVEAAAKAQHVALAHLAVGEDETAAFWSALAQMIRGMIQPFGRRR